MEKPEKSREINQVEADLTLNTSKPGETPEAVKKEFDAEVIAKIVADEKADEEAVAQSELFEEQERAEGEPRQRPESREQVIQQLTDLAAREADEIAREHVAHLKQAYYTIRRAELARERELFIAEGNAIEAFVESLDEHEEKLKELLNAIKEKKAARLAELEAEMQRNFEAKEALIDEIKKMAQDTDNVNRHFPRFREAQQEFKAAGVVSPQVINEQWKRFSEAVEIFYDQLKVNKDLRDYDFKKNLDTKLHLCDEAEQLAAEDDIITAFRRLQDLHDKWRETGPVAKEVRQEIWDRFKDASAVINKKYQAFFEERKEREQANETAKNEIIQRIEALDFEALKSFADWNAMTQTILDAQAEWKKLGFAARKVNTQLYNRFRELCDRFFSLKAEYFKKVKDDYTENLARKTALCEVAEALKDSTDWKKTADKFVELQAEWKKIGAVPKKYSDAVWQRFMAACDHFFERKKTDFTTTRKTEQANLKAKRALAERLRQLPDDLDKAKILEAIKDAQAEWQTIGHVPFKEKDKTYEEFRAAINELYAKHDLREQRAGMARFESSIEALAADENKLYRERERLARVLEQKRAELTTYRNNLGFFSFKSSQASSLQRDIERKTQRLEDDIRQLEEKIRLIDSKC